jgi:citrate lyase subunit beta/citryl-CoA lyase
VRALATVTPSTYLFVPANRLDRVEKAIATGADEVIVDLEDAVGTSEKDGARRELTSMQPSRSLCVRINDETTSFFDADMAAILALSWVKAVVVPKVDSASQVRRVLEQVGPDVGILALVETALGVRDADDIAASGAARLLFGTADYAAELGASPSRELYGYARARLVVASAAAGLTPPVDGPTLEIGDDERLQGDTELAKALGMGGKLCIHPNQVPVVARVFASVDRTRDWARAVLDGFAANDGNVFVLDGEMIDAPLVAQARRIHDH